MYKIIRKNPTGKIKLSDIEISRQIIVYRPNSIGNRNRWSYNVLHKLSKDLLEPSYGFVALNYPSNYPTFRASTWKESVNKALNKGVIVRVFDNVGEMLEAILNEKF